jgi:hypothetical protein
MARRVWQWAPQLVRLGVSVPTPVAFADFPILKIPVKPGAAIRQSGAGFTLGVSETAFMNVMALASVISAVAGC